MRRFWTPALLAVPLVFVGTTNSGNAKSDSTNSHGFPCGYDIAFRIFPHIHQHGPLYNYGPYYGYYPFTPYGPWDPYLRYNPYFYGDPYADFGNKMVPQEDHSGRYGPTSTNTHGGFRLFRSQRCRTCSTNRGVRRAGSGTRRGCTVAGSAGTPGSRGVRIRATNRRVLRVGELPSLSRPLRLGMCSSATPGSARPAQSAVYYPATPTLDPALRELIPTAGQ